MNRLTKKEIRSAPVWIHKPINRIQKMIFMIFRTKEVFEDMAIGLV